MYYRQLTITEVTLTCALFSQKSCHVETENSFDEEIWGYIEKQAPTSTDTNLPSRGKRRITYEVLDNKVKYVPKPDRTRELAKKTSASM